MYLCLTLMIYIFSDNHIMTIRDPNYTIIVVLTVILFAQKSQYYINYLVIICAASLTDITYVLQCELQLGFIF